MADVGEELRKLDIESLEALQTALDAAVVWHNSTEPGYRTNVDPVTARLLFFLASKAAGLPVVTPL